MPDPTPKPMCTGPQCTRPAAVMSLCKAHYAQVQRNGVVQPLREKKK